MRLIGILILAASSAITAGNLTVDGSITSQTAYVFPDGTEQTTAASVILSPSPENVITVAKSGSDHSNLVSAIAAANSASDENPILVIIHPGNYDIGGTTLVIPPYVQVVGSGVESTVIRGKPTGGVSGGVIKMSLFSGLKNLTIINESNTEEESVGLLIADVVNGTTPNSVNQQHRRYNVVIDNVHVVSIFDVLIATPNFHVNIPIHISNSRYILIRDSHVDAWALPGSISTQIGNYGINLSGSTKIDVKDTVIRSVGGADTRGLVLQNLSEIVVDGAHITGIAGQNFNYGINDVSGSSNVIRNSYIEGGHSAVRVSNNGHIRLLSNHLYPRNGAAVVKSGGGATASCVSTVDNNFNVLPSSC